MGVPNLAVVLICVIAAGAVVVVGAAFGRTLYARRKNEPEVDFNQRSPEQDAYLHRIREMNQMNVLRHVKALRGERDDSSRERHGNRYSRRYDRRPVSRDTATQGGTQSGMDHGYSHRNSVALEDARGSTRDSGYWHDGGQGHNGGGGGGGGYGGYGYENRYGSGNAPPSKAGVYASVNYEEDGTYDSYAHGEPTLTAHQPQPQLAQPQQYPQQQQPQQQQYSQGIYADERTVNNMA